MWPRAIEMHNGEELMQVISHSTCFIGSVSTFFTGRITPIFGNASASFSKLSITLALTVMSNGCNSIVLTRKRCNLGNNNLTVPWSEVTSGNVEITTLTLWGRVDRKPGIQASKLSRAMFAQVSWSIESRTITRVPWSSGHWIMPSNIHFLACSQSSRESSPLPSTALYCKCRLFTREKASEECCEVPNKR